LVAQRVGIAPLSIDDGNQMKEITYIMPSLICKEMDVDSEDAEYDVDAYFGWSNALCCPENGDGKYWRGRKVDGYSFFANIR